MCPCCTLVTVPSCGVIWRLMDRSSLSSLLYVFDTGHIRQETCYCPDSNLKNWYKQMSCSKSYKQIKNDLSIFKDVDLEKAAEETIQRFNISTAHSLARYRIINNKVNGENVNTELMYNISLTLRLLQDRRDCAL